MQAEQGYMTAMEFPEDVVSVAGVFQQAATTDPVHAKLQTGVAKTISQDITTMCSHFAVIQKLASCGALAVNDQIFMAQKLENPTAVYLRYSESCQFIVVFTPLGDNLASIWAYPLYEEVADRVLQTYFPHAENLDAAQIDSARKAGANAIFQAQCTDQKTDAKYYSQLATAVLKRAKSLKPDTVADYTTDEKIISDVVTLAQQMASGMQNTQVYHFPANMESQVTEILSSTEYSEQLEAYTRQQVYLSFPQQICNRYGNDWITTSAILATAIEADHMSATARTDETPVLVLIQLKGGACILMSIYPTQHNVYLYRYAVLPVPHAAASSMLASLGATRVR